MKNENRFWMALLVFMVIIFIGVTTSLKNFQEPETPLSTQVYKSSHPIDEDIAQMQKSVLRIERTVSDIQISILQINVNLLERALEACYSRDHIDCSCPDSLLAHPEDEYGSGLE
jgi:hypothetical protein